MRFKSGSKFKLWHLLRDIKFDFLKLEFIFGEVFGSQENSLDNTEIAETDPHLTSSP